MGERPAKRPAASPAEALLAGRDTARDARQLDDIAALLEATTPGTVWADAARAGAAGLRALTTTRARLDDVQTRYDRLRAAADSGLEALSAIDLDDETAAGRVALRALDQIEEALRG